MHNCNFMVYLFLFFFMLFQVFFILNYYFFLSKTIIPRWAKIYRLLIIPIFRYEDDLGGVFVTCP